MEQADRVLVHAAPSRIDVWVHDESGEVRMSAKGLKAAERTPMARLTVEGDAISREQIWPGEEDLGLPVILPGGEVGILTAWWNADDHSEWRWSVELSNHR
jgi:hypothetical protein